MLHKLFCLTLIVVLMSGMMNNVMAATQTDKVKATVAKMGTGTKAKVRVTLHNGNKLSGYISQSDDQSFTVTDPKTNAATPVSYSDVESVKGKGLSKGAKIAIIVTAGVAVVVVVLIVAAQNFHLNIDPTSGL